MNTIADPEFGYNMIFVCLWIIPSTGSNVIEWPFLNYLLETLINGLEGLQSPIRTQRKKFVHQTIRSQIAEKDASS